MNLISTEGNIQAIYLRLLYSGTNEMTVCSENNNLLGIDTDRLLIERQARVRNLQVFLARQLVFLGSIADKETFLTWTDEYCRSENFWKFIGRNIAENFCIFLYERYDEDFIFSEVVKLQGICSGIAESGSADSPWFGNAIQRVDSSVIESYKLPFFFRISEIHSMQHIRKTYKSNCPSTISVRREGENISISVNED